MATLYERLKFLCEKNGIKGAQMCNELGFSKSLMTDLKHGRKTGVSAVTAQKIASYFDVSVGYLLGEEESTQKEKAPVVSDEDVKVALFGGDTEVTDEMWSEVMNYAEYLKQKYRKT